MRKPMNAATLCAALPIAMMLLASDSSAHGPTRQKVSESVLIDAPPAAVWAVVSDYAALQAWHPAVERSESTEGNTEGSLRTLHLKGGGVVVERLKKYDADAMSYSYRMEDPGPIPVSNYSATLSVSAQGSGSEVQWKGAFYRGDPNNDPPPQRNDEAAVQAITGIYQAGLGHLKALIERK